MIETWFTLYIVFEYLVFDYLPIKATTLNPIYAFATFSCLTCLATSKVKNKNIDLKKIHMKKIGRQNSCHFINGLKFQPLVNEEWRRPPAFLSLDFHLYYAIIDLRLGIYVWFLCVTRSFLPVRKNVQRHSGEKANLTFLSDSVTKIYILEFLLILAGEGGVYIAFLLLSSACSFLLKLCGKFRTSVKEFYGTAIRRASFG